ncbi:MAG: glutathione peroxidase [Acidobacteriota bacterium]
MSSSDLDDNVSIYSFSAPLLDGRETSLEPYRGKVLLIVNTASRCGFTPQYGALEALYRKERERGLVVLAFPCNQFGAQEPGSAADIAQFCTLNYGVSFPVFAKIEVNGSRTHPLYRFLKKKKPGWFGLFTGGRIHWNFTKFVLDRSGRVAARFGPATPPARIAPLLDRLLGPP